MAKKAAPKAAPKAAAAPPAAAPAEKTASPRAKAATKAEIYSKIGEKTGLSKKGGTGLFVIPGLLKLKVVNKPATKAKQGINPFTKAPMTFKAKPARRVVKAIPLKALKDSV